MINNTNHTIIDNHSSNAFIVVLDDTGQFITTKNRLAGGQLYIVLNDNVALYDKRCNYLDLSQIRGKSILTKGVIANVVVNHQPTRTIIRLKYISISIIDSIDRLSAGHVAYIR